MKIYISGSYSHQARLREESHKLFAMGHHITSTWLNEVVKPYYLTEEEWFHALAVKDLAEVAAADCIICDLDGASTSGGRYVEWGFAIGKFNMLKLVVGSNRYGVFNTLANRGFNTWVEVVDYFKTLTPVEVHKEAGNVTAIPF